MKKKIMCVFVCMLLVFTAIVIVPDDLKVVATPGGGDEGDLGLDYQYIRNITESLSNVILNPIVYGEDELKKGRVFGSEGERYAAEYIIKDTMENDLGLYNPGLDPPYLDQMESIPSWHEHVATVNLTEKIDVLAKAIKVNGTEDIECHIRPQWNWRCWAEIAEQKYPNLDDILEWLLSVLGFNTSDWWRYNMIFNESWLTKNVSYENLSLIHGSANYTWFFDVLDDRTDEIIDNINNGSIANYSSFMHYFLPEIQEYHNFTFGTLNSSNAEKKPVLV